MKTVKSLLIAFALTFPVITITAPEAKADLMVCNNSAAKAYVAKAWYSKKGWVASGWTHVFPNECQTILFGDMRYNSAYIYAADYEWKPWKFPQKYRATPFCLTQSPFFMKNANGRCSTKMIQKQFYRFRSDRGYDYRLNLK